MANRIIKFRARYICGNCGKTYWMDFRCGQVMLLNHQQDCGRSYRCEKGGWCDQHQTGEIVQFTGLKDKNGVESYSNDKIKLRDGDYTAVGIVVWGEKTGQWMWEATEVNEAMTIARGQNYPLWTILHKQRRYQGTVISNIHEEKEGE